MAEALGTWFHVDGAYGAAALVAPSVRDRFVGIERADSLIVDPHKWLFAPFDCCALIYRDPRIGKAAHTQQAEYLDVLHDDDDWNPSDFAHHLSRRARGLPLWFSLATHGTDAYRDAVETTLEVAHAGAELIRRSDHCELVVEPELSIVMFRRLGLEPATVPRVERSPVGVAAIVRRPDLVARRDGPALLPGEPADDHRRHRRDPGVAPLTHRTNRRPMADLVISRARCRNDGRRASGARRRLGRRSPTDSSRRSAPGRSAGRGRHDRREPTAWSRRGW